MLMFLRILLQVDVGFYVITFQFSILTTKFESFIVSLKILLYDTFIPLPSHLCKYERIHIKHTIKDLLLS